MKAVVFDTHDFDRVALTAANASAGHELTFVHAPLDQATASLAAGQDAAICFVNDQLDAAALGVLAKGGVRLIALRCAGRNNLDLAAAHRLGMRAVSVPSYAPYAVAEHVFALLLTLIRNTARAHDRVRNGNFSVEGLVGFNLHGKIFGLVGLGRIGRAVAAIAHGMGCRLVACDEVAVAGDLPIEFMALEPLLAASQVVSLHAPLTPATHHMIDAERIALLQPGAVLINTSRGGLIDTVALVEALKQGRLGGVGLDVYEEEASVFFRDRSNDVMRDDVLARLLTFPNVMLTSHMGFLTREALREIADTTIASLSDCDAGRPLRHEIIDPI